MNLLRLIGHILSKATPACIVLLRHNDSKTCKFLFRNLFALFSLCIEDSSREMALNFNTSMHREITIVGFYVHALLYNYGCSAQVKACKRELTQIFIRQLCKSLLFKAQPQSKLQESAALLQKFSSVWLIARFLTMRPFEPNSKDAAGAIMQKKEKYYRLQRTHIVK